MARSRVLHGDCLSRLRQLPANSVDSLVTDPPAGISFMGKDWDHHKGGRDEWIAWLEGVMRECLRVMKPGAHGLVWALPRTSHWTATALENAGFEVRDVVTHLFGSGFPKSLDVSKAIDRAAGAKREVVGRKADPRYRSSATETSGSPMGHCAPRKNSAVNYANAGLVFAPATDAAKRWQGFGTALKPASEHWVLVRKPCSEKTVAANVLRWGTGALAIDASRIGTQENLNGGAYSKTDRENKFFKNLDPGAGAYAQPAGRWPANLLLSPEAAAELDRQSGTLKTHGGGYGEHKGSEMFSGGRVSKNNQPKDSGGASRFFYIAKPSRRERNLGCEGMPKRTKRILNGGIPSAVNSDPHGMSGGGDRQATNHHPCVKPISLMRYLIRMVTPPGGLTLDPFCGSGTTGCAARREGFRFLGIEQSAEYVAIARARIQAAQAAEAAR